MSSRISSRVLPSASSEAKRINFCWDPAIMGSWYRQDRDGTKEEFTAYPDGNASFATYRPHEAGGLVTATIGPRGTPPCQASIDKKRLPKNTPPYPIMVDVEFYGIPHIFDQGHRIEFLNSSTGNRQPLPYGRTFERAFRVPLVDFRKRVKDGYSWDFNHVCAPYGVAKLDRMLTDPHYLWSVWFNHELSPKYIQFRMISGNRILWSEGNQNAPLLPTEFCVPDSHTLVVAQPGPRGTEIPEAYDLLVEDSLSALFVNGYQGFHKINQ